MEIEVGMRVRVFVPALYKDDVSTPLSVTMQNGTVIKRDKARKSEFFGWIDDVIEVLLDYNNKKSTHFTSSAILL